MVNVLGWCTLSYHAIRDWCVRFGIPVLFRERVRCQRNVQLREHEPHPGPRTLGAARRKGCGRLLGEHVASVVVVAILVVAVMGVVVLMLVFVHVILVVVVVGWYVGVRARAVSSGGGVDVGVGGLVVGDLFLTRMYGEPVVVAVVVVVKSTVGKGVCTPSFVSGPRTWRRGGVVMWWRHGVAAGARP